MPPRQCVVQDCSRVSNKELGISMHTSPASSNIRSKWKRFVRQHRKNFNPTGTFGICSLHFKTDCFARAVHLKGTERRIKPGSVPTVWKVTSDSISERSHRRVSRFLPTAYLRLFFLVIVCLTGNRDYYCKLVIPLTFVEIISIFVEVIVSFHVVVYKPFSELNTLFLHLAPLLISAFIYEEKQLVLRMFAGPVFAEKKRGCLKYSSSRVVCMCCFHTYHSFPVIAINSLLHDSIALCEW